MPKEPKRKTSKVAKPQEVNAQSERIVDPSGATADHPVRPWLQPAGQPLRRKPLVIAGIVSAVLLLVLLVGWAVYAFWYQNPNKVMTDALIHAANAKSVAGTGHLSVTEGDTDIDVTLDGGFGESGGNFRTELKFTLPNLNSSTPQVTFQSLYDGNGSLYVKPDSLTRAINSLILSYVGSLSGGTDAKISAPIISDFTEIFTGQVFPILNKIDGKWIKVNADELRGSGIEAAEQYTCIEKALRGAREDKATMVQYGSLFAKNPFISIKKELGTKDGSAGYELAIDDKALKRFESDVKATKLFKDYERCGDGRTNDESDKEKTERTYQLEVWVDRWTHRFTHINGSMTQVTPDTSTKVIFDVKPNFDKPVEVSIPSDSNTIPLRDVTDDINGLMLPGLH